MQKMNMLQDTWITWLVLHKLSVLFQFIYLIHYHKTRSARRMRGSFQILGLMCLGTMRCRCSQIWTILHKHMRLYPTTSPARQTTAAQLTRVRTFYDELVQEQNLSTEVSKIGQRAYCLLFQEYCLQLFNVIIPHKFDAQQHTLITDSNSWCRRLSRNSALSIVSSFRRCALYCQGALVSAFWQF